MRVKSITFGMTRTTKKYESDRADIVVELGDGDSFAEATALAKQRCLEALGLGKRPKIGDHVRVVECSHAPDAVGRFGELIKVDLTDLPYLVELYVPSKTHGSHVWVEKVEYQNP